MNKEKCMFCNKGIAEFPITDGETLREIWICEKCDKDLEMHYWIQEIKATGNFIVKKKVKKLNRKAVGERKQRQ
jgi:hypothetical protein